MKRDLHTLSERNSIFKYTDNTKLCVLEHTDAVLKDEIANTQEWTRCNKMIMNYSETEEIFFTQVSS